MAWKAAITGWDLDGPDLTVGYYDDATPPNEDGSQVFLYIQTFRRADVASNADLRRQVIATGQRIRAVYQRVQAFKATGDIPIP